MLVDKLPPLNLLYNFVQNKTDSRHNPLLFIIPLILSWSYSSILAEISVKIRKRVKTTIKCGLGNGSFVL